MCNKNWLIIFLIILGAGLVILKNREKTAPIAPQETAQQTITEETPATEQVTAPTAEQDTDSQEPTVTPKVKPTTEKVASESPAVTVKKQQPIESKTISPEKAISTTSEQDPAVKATTQEQSVPVQAGSRQPVTPPTEQVTGEQRTVSVQNAITKKMLGYRYFGTHYPTSFKITANGKEIKEDGKEFIKLANNQVTVRYSFEFLNGKRKGAKEITFAVKPQADNLSIAFDWKDTWRILIDKEKAEPISAKEIE